MNLRIIAAAYLLVSLTACGGSKGSPTQPTPQPTPTPTPSPATTFTLSGTVSESTPTTGTRISGARVEVTGGQHAGKAATTDGAGAFSISDLTGQVDVRVSANGYVETSAGRSMTQNQTLTVNLVPVYRAVAEEFNGPLSGGDPTCSDGVFTKPCKIISLPIHHSGILEATMGWAGSADLDLTLFRGSSIIVSSRGVGSTERISTNVIAGLYELRITYYQGSMIATYNLRVNRPN
jgi:hypothetical protein